MLLPFALFCLFLPWAIVGQTTNAETINVFGKNLVQDNVSHIIRLNDSYAIKPKMIVTGLQEIKIGVLLPFSQRNDNDTEGIAWSGMSAIRLAANEINQQRTIPGAYITLVQKDSFPGKDVNQDAYSGAVLAAVQLLKEGVIGVIGDVSSSWTSLSAIMTSLLSTPQCSFSADQPFFSDKSQFATFFRTVPTSAVVADAMIAFALKQGWSRIGVLASNDIDGQQFYQRVILRSTDMHITRYQSFPNGTNKDMLSESISNVTSDARIILVSATGEDLGNILIEAAKLGVMSNDYVWLFGGDQYAEIIDYVYQQNTMLNVNATLSGTFWFSSWSQLYGYEPYESFLDSWALLNATSYPFAGQRKTEYLEGNAYSCMMLLAEGFNHIISNTTSNFTLGLSELVGSTLGDSMVPPSFNTGYVGPEGPMILDANGDLVHGNYRIFNSYSGNTSLVGQMLNGHLSMTAPPIFHDGTSVPPVDSRPGELLNLDWSAPISHAILVVVIIGLLLSLAIFATVVINRKHEVFKAASPLFCCLELIGFMFTYVSATFLVGVPSRASCIVMPVTFNLGFMLVLGNLIAKNYRIYRIFNNIFIARTVITDRQLVKSVLAVVSVNMIILIVGLSVTQPVPTKTPLLQAYYYTCKSDSSAALVFVILNSIYASCLLLFATFLAYKTRLAGQQYSHYSECKQMGLSVYNILFSALIGFVVTVNPIADFYTKYYISVIAILWATTFSLLILFLPKLHTFFQEWRKVRVKEKEKKQMEESQEQHSNLPDSGEAHSAWQQNETRAPDGEWFFTMLNTGTAGSLARSEQSGPNLLSLEQIIGSDTQLCQDRKPSTASHGGADANADDANLIEVHQSEMPIRRVFRYFPDLSQWEMQHVMVFPLLGYFSHFSKESNKGHVLSYVHATVHSAQLEDYVLKIHGQGMYDVYLQVPSLRALEAWQQCFNCRQPPTQSFRRSPPRSAEILRSFQQQSSVHMSPSQDPLIARRDSESNQLRIKEDEEDTLSDETVPHRNP